MTLVEDDLLLDSEVSWVLFLPVFERSRDTSKRYLQDFRDCVVRMVGDCLSDDRSCR